MTEASRIWTGEVRYYIGDEQMSRRLAFGKDADALRVNIVLAAAEIGKATP